MIPLPLEKLAGPLLRAALIALGVVTILGGAYLMGRHDGSAIANGKVDKATADFWKAQAEASDKINEAASARIRELEATSNDEKAKVDAYRAELAKRPAPACALTPDDVQRLRDIGTGRGRQSALGPHAPAAR